MPHLERETPEGDWLELEGTSHRQCSAKKKPSLDVVKIHGILEDTEGVREVADALGDVCLKPPREKRKWRNNWSENDHHHSGVILI